jgi:hypothetical protein
VNSSSGYGREGWEGAAKSTRILEFRWGKGLRMGMAARLKLALNAWLFKLRPNPFRRQQLSMTRTDEPSMPSEPSFIFNLPNEVLGEIFSYISVTDIVQRSENGKNRILYQFDVLLRESRAFRMPAFASHTIHEWESNITSLVPFILLFLISDPVACDIVECL